MKNYKEIAADIFERRDAYVAQQKQKRKTVMKITSVACAFAVVAAVGVGLWQGGAFDTEVPPVEEPNENATTTAPTENDGPGVGGDISDEDCQVHNFYYHMIAHFPDELIDSFLESYSGEDINVVNFVQFHGITREEFIASYNGMWTEENLDEIVWNHGNGCPYTKNQFLDAIYGDDPELTAWVFAPNSTWPESDVWSSTGAEGFIPEEWPPEGYGFGETRPE